MKSKSFALRIGSALCAVVAVALVAQPIFAQKAFLKQLKALYPDIDKAVANCAFCHTFDKEKKEHPDKKNINAFAKTLHDQPSMKTVIDQKEGDDHKFTEDELKNVQTALKALIPDKAALDKIIADKKK
jgi:cytochrome c553